MNEQSQELLQAIRGPVILITVGTLFAIERYTRFPFEKTWPVLMIVIGLLRLLGGPRRRRYPTYSSPQAPPQTPASPPPVPGARP